MASIIQSVTSADGTTLGYRCLGSGPGVLLLHGGMESSVDHLELAERLSARFTVVLPDRRGRGLSGPMSSGEAIDRELQDLAAVLDHSGATMAFGISSGAIVLLQAAHRLDRFTRLAVMEPPLPVNGEWASGWTPERFLESYRTRVAAGDLSGAAAFGLKVTQMGPAFLHKSPEWLLKSASAFALWREGRRGDQDRTGQRELIPTLLEDIGLIIEAQHDWDAFKRTRADVLILAGSLSPDYLQRSTAQLQSVFPGAHTVTIQGAGHGASGNANRGGKPDEVARALADFFG